MYNTFSDSLSAAIKKTELELQEKIKQLQAQFEEKHEKFSKMQCYCNNDNSDIAKFMKIITEYGYTVSDFLMYNLKADRCPFCISNDNGEFKVPVAICKTKKKSGKFYLTFETRINETMVNEKIEDEYATIRNAMYAIPRIHIFLDSDNELKNLFFSLAKDLKEVKETKSSDHFINYTCHVVKENIKNIKIFNELE